MGSARACRVAEILGMLLYTDSSPDTPNGRSQHPTWQGKLPEPVGLSAANKIACQGSISDLFIGPAA